MVRQGRLQGEVTLALGQLRYIFSLSNCTKFAFGSRAEEVRDAQLFCMSASYGHQVDLTQRPSGETHAVQTCLVHALCDMRYGR